MELVRWRWGEEDEGVDDHGVKGEFQYEWECAKEGGKDRQCKASLVQ